MRGRNYSLRSKLQPIRRFWKVCRQLFHNQDWGRVARHLPTIEVFHAFESESVGLPASRELGGDGVNSLPGWLDILVRSLTRCRGRKPSPGLP